MLLSVVILAAALAAPPALTGNAVPVAETLPTLSALLSGVVARDAQTQRELKAMEYDERVVTQRLNPAGQVIQHQDMRLVVRPGLTPQLVVISVKGDHLPTDPDEAARQARGKEIQRRRQTLDLKELAGRFRLSLLGTADDAGAKVYEVGFEPKPGQPFHSQTEKVLNQLRGRMWVRASDDTILRTEATLANPVQVAWIFAGITRLDFHYELSPGGGEYGPAWLETRVEVRAPLVDIIQHQRVEMDHFRSLPAPLNSGSRNTP